MICSLILYRTNTTLTGHIGAKILKMEVQETRVLKEAKEIVGKKIANMETMIKYHDAAQRKRKRQLKEEAKFKISLTKRLTFLNQ